MLDYQPDATEGDISAKEKRGSDEANLFGWLISVLDYQPDSN